MTNRNILILIFTAFLGVSKDGKIWAEKSGEQRWMGAQNKRRSGKINEFCITIKYTILYNFIDLK